MKKTAKKQTAKQEVFDGKAKTSIDMIAVYEMELDGMHNELYDLRQDFLSDHSMSMAMARDLSIISMYLKKHNWTFGDSLWKRALAFLGWSSLGYLIILAGLFTASFIVGLLINL